MPGRSKAKGRPQKRPAKGLPSIGTLIRRLREEAGIPQHALARQAGVDAAVLFRLEQGGPGARFDTVCRLADALGVSVDSLSAATGLTTREKSDAPLLTRYATVRAAASRSQALLKAVLDDLERGLKE